MLAYRGGIGLVAKTQVDVIFNRRHFLKLKAPEKWVIKPKDDKLIELFPIAPVRSIVPPIVFQLDKKIWELYNVDTSVNSNQITMRYVVATPLATADYTKDGKTPEERHSGLVQAKKDQSRINLEKEDSIVVHVTEDQEPQVPDDYKTIGNLKRYGTTIYTTYEIESTPHRYTLATIRSKLSESTAPTSTIAQPYPYTIIYYTVTSDNVLSNNQINEIQNKWNFILRPTWYRL